MRLRNTVSGVVINVRDGHPLTTDSQWAPAEVPKRTKKTESKDSE